MPFPKIPWKIPGRWDRMVVGFTTTCAIIAYHLYSCEFEPHSWWDALDTALCDKVCQWLATGRWFPPGTPVSSTNKTDLHDTAEILLKVALSTITSQPTILYIMTSGASLHLYSYHSDKHYVPWTLTQHGRAVFLIQFCFYCRCCVIILLNWNKMDHTCHQMRCYKLSKKDQKLFVENV